ncbi:MAG: glycerate kinase [Anaerolineae bacterium]|nr:glycerate kinase [Anaerolineae bacterium]
MLKVVIAPSGFKESLDAEEAAHCIADGVMRVLPDAIITKVPLMDGGEGFTKALVKLTGGTMHPVVVTGPVGQSVRAFVGILGGTEQRTAIIEMAAAAGLRLVPRDQRNPLSTTTYGVGELIQHALSLNVKRILIGCGDSGTNDGGAGMAQALGAKLLDSAGNPISRGSAELSRLAQIDLSNLDRRLKYVQIDVACNWTNILCGPKGVARVFGPQKGGSPEMVERMSAALENFASVIENVLGVDVREIPGSGASGGLGAGLVAFLGATLHPRYDIVMRYLDLNTLLQNADLVLTAEGSLDFQTPHGKVPAEVARRAKQYGLPVIVLAGTLGSGVDDNYRHGIDAFASIIPAPITLEHALEHAGDYLTNAAEHAMRKVMIGYRLAEHKSA